MGQNNDLPFQGGVGQICFIRGRSQCEQCEGAE